ncbi:MAG: pyridoxal phosphate-dependent aminotransferase family protein [Deltaproteobacteria bacterium]|nr:pyridoxal phosphate-dependent aminotransferase family protein [Deltaproteobacteria bacterium]
MSDFINIYNELLNKNRLRKLKVIDIDKVTAKTADGNKIVFCSNDYLGLSFNKDIIEQEIEILKKSGSGSGASRLVSGNSSYHQNLENYFAEFSKKPRAVLFSSGYQANVGTISTLAKKGDHIFSDELCHASIIDGCRLSKAEIHVYNHLDTEQLEDLLLENKNSDGNRFIITEGIFSMDGDLPPLEEITEIAQKNRSFLYLDEAHSIGILGPGGRGLAAQLNLSDKIDILMGTFGKAVASSGAAAGVDFPVDEVLKSSARSMVYSTALPPHICAGTLKSLQIINDADTLREKLFDNIKYFKKQACTKNIPLIKSDTPIQPIIIGGEEETMKISQKLWDRGFFVQGIRPPTVKPGSSRLRVTVTAAHTTEQIDSLIETLEKII